MARSVGRLDFWNLEKELTPFELSLHRAAEVVEPYGDYRADLRSAINTMSLLQGQSTVKFTDDTREKIITALISYLQSDDDDEVMTPEEAAQHGMRQFARIRNRNV